MIPVVGQAFRESFFGKSQGAEFSGILWRFLSGITEELSMESATLMLLDVIENS